MNCGYGVVHCVARCVDCGWGTESHKNGQAISKIHAQRHKHKVEGEIGIAFFYDGKA